MIWEDELIREGMRVAGLAVGERVCYALVAAFEWYTFRGAEYGKI
jgi:hypothetical protein